MIGKASSGVDYCIRDNTTISRVHAKILRHGTQYFIQDNDSMNPTYVDGRQVMNGLGTADPEWKQDPVE